MTGLIDRALRLNEDTMEAEDLKTAIVPKSQWEMEQDLQLAIYYTACRALFPTMPNVILSLVWVRHGCKSTITFRDDIIEACLKHNVSPDELLVEVSQGQFGY